MNRFPKLGILMLALCLPGAIHAQKLAVTAVSHDVNQYNYTVTTPTQSNTYCTATDTSANCNTTTYGGGTQNKALYRFTQIVRAEVDGKTMQYTLTRTARWVWSAMDYLNDGESYPAEIKGKHMYITGRKGGNQGKKETLKYDILDIRPTN